LSKEIHNFEDWKHDKEHGRQFISIVEQDGEILVVERIKDKKQFSLGPHLYSGGGVFVIKEFMLNMKHVRFMIDGNPSTNSSGENFRIQTIGKIPINYLKLSANGRELSL
jgi:hypothetical protein